MGESTGGKCYGESKSILALAPPEKRVEGMMSQGVNFWKYRVVISGGVKKGKKVKSEGLCKRVCKGMKGRE